MHPRIEYFDMHCHILPQVDDGASSMEMSLEMIRMEYEQGIRGILLTPHHAAGDGNMDQIRLRYQELVEAAGKAYPDIRLLLGNELMYSDSILEELADGRALALNQTDYVLVEFHIGVPWKQMQAAFRRLTESGWRPILAHMERFQCLDRQTERIDALIDQGVYMQMNSSSVIGGVFDRQAAYCRKLVSSGRVHLMGTDAHQTGWRPPDMGRAIQELNRRDKNLLQDLLIHNPEKILANGYIG